MNPHSTYLPYLSVILLSACCFQQKPTEPLVVDPIAIYTETYRNALAEYRSKYPQEYEMLKQAYIEAYAALPEYPTNWKEVYHDIEGSVWEKAVAQGRIADSSKEAKTHFIAEIYPAMWEEIMLSTDSSNTPQQVKQRKAICNIANFTIYPNECSMPPWVRINYSDNCGIVCLPHPKAHTEEWRDHYYLVRLESLSAEEQELAQWYDAENKALYKLRTQDYEDFSKKQKSLNEEYAKRRQAIKKSRQ